MPFEMTVRQLPGGARYLWMETSGHFSEADAGAFVKETSPGGGLYRLPRLVNTQKQTSISPEARAVFASVGEEGEAEPWVALVVTNPVVRVTTNFLIRVNRNKRIRMFAAEPEALQWLEERIREEAAKK